MATTDWTRAAEHQAKCPHTFEALQALVMAMAQCAHTYGKRTFFGRDKGEKPFEAFKAALVNTVFALVMDGEIEPESSPFAVRFKLIQHLTAFFKTFPNWPDAEEFSYFWFSGNRAEAESLIANILNT